MDGGLTQEEELVILSMQAPNLQLKKLGTAGHKNPNPLQLRWQFISGGKKNKARHISQQREGGWS
ncbi:hypothetical protein HPP92_027297 [Vanilla planifolia]|uniref:Uncharacterized protein n=1 Tax=Vanilla planifolia TaxID=51239 RepID=A0A835PD17_VANPL|nr:hypothetical protein HPP92_027297 [Vanilla planifolia]